MGIGGGDSFSASAALTIVSIIGSLFLLIHPPLVKWLEKNNSLNQKTLNHLKSTSPLIPPIAYFLAMLLHIYDHLVLNFRNEHVSSYLNESSDIISRIFAVFIGPSGRIELLILIYATCVCAMIYNKPKSLFSVFPTLRKSKKSSDKFIQFSGFFWFVILAGFLPSNSFAKNSVEIIGTGLSESQIYSAFFEGLLGIILLGLCLSFTVFSVSLHSLSSQNRKSHYHLFILIPMFICVLLFTKLSVLFTGVNWYSTGSFQLFSLELEQAILDPYFGSSLAIFVSIFSMIIFLPIIQYWDKNMNSTKFEGDYRWLALGLSYLHGLLIIIFGTFFVMRNTESIASIQGSLWLALKSATPIISFGLMGSLLPVIGFDEDVRPELWGWRIGLVFGVLVNSLWNPLIVYAIPCVIIAVLCSYFIPLVIETNNGLSMGYKVMLGVIAMLLTSPLLLQTSIVNISSSIFIFTIISFTFAMIFELVNNYNIASKNDNIDEQE